MTCRAAIQSFGDTRHLVGDPVDVVTGAVVDVTIDVALDAPFPFAFRRHYDSRHHRKNRGLGWGHTPGFDHSLFFTYDDAVCYVAPDEQRVSFPAPMQDGAVVGRLGYRLERRQWDWYRLHLPEGDEVLEFRFGRLEWPARLVAITHPEGSTQFGYDDATGRLRYCVDSLGRTIRVDWADVLDSHRGVHQPHIVALVLVPPAPSTESERPLITYHYDSAANLVGAVDAYGNPYTFVYDQDHRVTRRVDQNGYAFTYAYDARGRCVYSAGQDGVEEVRLEYLEGATVVTLADGGEWLYRHDGGFLTSVIDPYGGELRRELGDDGQLGEETDPAGRHFTVVRDDAGKAIGRRDSAGALWPMDEAPAPPVHYFADRAREWDFGLLLEPTYGLPIRRYLEIAGLPRFVVDALTPAPTGSMNADLQERWRETLVKDLHGLPLRIERSDGTRCSWSYDNNGNEVRYTDFDGASWRTGYTSWNHASEIVDPLGGVTRLVESRREELLSVVDADGCTSAYGYDLNNRLSSVTRDGVLRETYTYDAGDELTEKADGHGRWLQRWTREDDGRTEICSFASGERQELHYTTAQLLRTATIEAAGGQRDEYAFDYDLALDPVLDTRNGLGAERVFREDDSLAEIQILGRFTTSYEWQDSTRLRITDPTGAVHAVQICNGGVVRRTTSNGVTEVTHYEPHGHCTAKLVYTRDESRWERYYDRSGERDVLAIRDSARGTSRFSYDAAHRLVGELLPSGQSRAFRHSPAGDLLEAPGLTGVTTQHHRIHAANGSRFEHDHRQNLSARHNLKGTTRFLHDSADQLVGVTGPDVGTWSARYDMWSRRIETVANGAKTTFYWDGDRLAAEILPDGRVRVYVYADVFATVPMMFVDYEGLDAPTASGTRYFVLANHLGAPEIIHDDRGQVVWRARYEAYGAAVIEIGSDFHQPLRWAGHYFDAATGLHYSRYRYYSPELGRFLESDPAGIEGGWNLHAYAEGNPLRAVDVDGLGCPPKKTPPKKGKGKPKKEGNRPKKKKPELKEFESAKYGKLKGKTGRGKLDRDHIPSFAAVRQAMAKQRKEAGLPRMTPEQQRNLKNNLNAIAVKSGVHRQGRTYGNKNKKLYPTDSGNLQNAARKDIAQTKKNLKEAGHDPNQVDSAFRKLNKLNKDAGVYDKPLPDSLLDPP